MNIVILVQKSALCTKCTSMQDTTSTIKSDIYIITHDITSEHPWLDACSIHKLPSLVSQGDFLGSVVHGHHIMKALWSLGEMFSLRHAPKSEVMCVYIC